MLSRLHTSLRLRRDETLADLVPAGLLMAASADFIAGAWCSAAELYELGLVAQYEFVEDGGDWEKHTVVQNAFLHLTYINACARTVNSDLAALISAKTSSDWCARPHRGHYQYSEFERHRPLGVFWHE